MMQLALLGDDDELIPLAAAAVALGHELVWVGERTQTAQLRALAPRAVYGESWESLLNYPQLDGVLIGRAGPDGRAGNEELRAEQLRKLVQADVHTLVVHPVAPSMLLYYELDMIRREAHGVLQHYTPGAGHPLVEQLAVLVREGDAAAIGPVEQITCDRRLIQRDREAVLAQFARDADLLLAIAGEPDRIGALGASDDDAVYANLGIQMACPAGPSIRWSAGPVEDAPGGRLVLIGASGKAVLQMPDEQPWSLELFRHGEPVDAPIARFDPAAAAIERWTAAIEQGDAGDDWGAACLTVELADATVRSLAKQRTIPLHHEEFSEQATFKGTMASVGCALILGAMALVLAAGLLGDVIGLPQGLVRLWPLALLAVLAVFLLLQLLPGIVFSPRNRKPPR